MRRSLLGVIVATAVAAAIVPGCQRVQQSAALPVMGDTLRGVVQLVGSEPNNTVQLRLSAGRVVSLSGSELGALRMAAGIEVMTHGAVDAATGAFAVDRFAVRAVDGMAAVDGWLTAAAAGRFTLRLADGKEQALVGVPPGLAPQVGARVFWVGPFDRAPSAYGLLSVPR
jgi:hypothetical protein